MKDIVVSERSKNYKACKKCTRNRSENCHSSCDEYATEVILGILLETEEKKAVQKRVDSYAVCEKKALRIAKSSPGAKKKMRMNGYIRNQGR